MNHFRTASAVLLATTCLALPRLAHADEAPAQVSGQNYATGPAVPRMEPSGGDKFGSRASWALSNDAGLSISYSHLSGSNEQSSNVFNLSLRPGLDFFVMENFSVGVFTGINYTHQSGAHTLQFSIGGRAGYNFWLTDHISVWPRLGLSYALHGVGNGVTSLSTNSLALNLSAPFLYNAEHIFLGFGPALDVDLTGNNKTTAISGILTIGCWF